MTQEHMQELRERAAIAAMQALIQQGKLRNHEMLAESAVEYADALVEELSK